ncbi:gamma carbonic anhydrase family protein [Halosegnis marinus]|uniref:Gamma carbonic anhydrase family protein n=1 Tax=Halosegnis marinus TaxID=3034023 RepID=A0ABD5ZKA2_9EURY|nr:gamma carbonic anhydrase family protein [Halosegnis sp. DT85]
MVVRSLDGTEPEIHDSAYVDETAVVVGDVTLDADASVWPNAVLRGDRGHIRVGEGANVQDGAVCHEGADLKPGATVGHNAVVHAATVGERALVGMGAVVLDRSVVGTEAMVAANALVTEGTEIPPNTLVAGVPADPVREYDESPWAFAGEEYVRLKERHRDTSTRVE